MYRCGGAGRLALPCFGFGNIYLVAGFRARFRNEFEMLYRHRASRGLAKSSCRTRNAFLYTTLHDQEMFLAQYCLIRLLECSFDISGNGFICTRFVDKIVFTRL